MTADVIERDFRQKVCEHLRLEPEGIGRYRVFTPFMFDDGDQTHDPEGKYPADCRINGVARPLLVFALQNDDKVRDSTIALLQYERWQMPFSSMGIFEDQEETSRKVLARFSDVCEKQFSNLASNQDRIARYLETWLQSTSR